MFGALLFVLAASSIGAKPEFRTPFEKVTMEAGKRLFFVCQAEGERPITYKWYNQDEDELTEDDKLPVHAMGWGNDSALLFKNVSSEHKGSYTCTASNAHGLTSKVFILRVPPPSEGNDTEIDQGNGTSRFRDAKVLKHTASSVTSKYIGKYIEAKYREGKRPSNTTTIRLDPGPKPEFQTLFENVTMEAGKWGFFVCKAEGERPITYKWYNQDEDAMTEDDKLPVYVVGWGNDSALFFKNVSSRQEGWYTCTASNAHGLASKVFFLRVPLPSEGNDTEIDQGNGTSRFRDAKVLKHTDSSVTFVITTSGPVKYIEAKYREAKRPSNTTIIRLNPVPGMNHEIGNLIPGGSYSFQFRTVPPESNVWSREYNVTLLPGVPDLPDAPQITLQNIGDRSVKLQWLMREGDVLSGIDRYQIKYFSVEMVGENIWKPRNCSVTFEVATCVGSSYTILELERTVFYEIEVRAHNQAGYSEPWRQRVYLP